MKRTLPLFLLGLFGLFIVAGCTPSQPTPTPQTVIAPSHLPSQTATKTPAPTLTNEPTLDQNALLATNQTESLSKFATSKANAAQYALPPSSTPRPASSPTSTSTPLPTATPIGNDAFALEMSERGYTVRSAGTIQDGSYTYHAYLFREPEENGSGRYYDVIRETWIIAFYRQDGEKMDLMGTFYPASWSKREMDESYPILYKFINWDDPQGTFIPFEVFYEPDEETRISAGLNQYISDINHNGRYEFSLIAQYCPVSCSRPVNEFHFFEISKTGKPIDLAAGMPGHLGLLSFSTDPVVFIVSERYGYGFFTNVNIPHYYEWRDDQFVEVTTQYKDSIIEWETERISELKAQYGQPFYGEPNETTLVGIPMIYQSLGMGNTGLTIFLEVSDLANWPETDMVTACWLQYSRAHYSTEYASSQSFTLPWNSSAFDPALSSYTLKQELDKLDPTQYDLTACYALIPDE